MTRLWLAWAAGMLNGFILFALVALLATHCAGCSHEAKPAVHIPALVPPSEGVPPYVWVERWVEPAILCVVDRGIHEPVIDRGAWSCPLSAGEQQ